MTEDTKNDLPKNLEHSVALLQIQISAANRFIDLYHNVILQIEPLLGGHVLFSEIFALQTYYPIAMSKVTVWKEPATAIAYDINHQQGTWEGRNFKVTSLDSVNTMKLKEFFFFPALRANYVCSENSVQLTKFLAGLDGQ